MPPPQPKLSEALLAFAQPLLKLLPPGAGAAERMPMLRIAHLVWNAVVLEELGSDSRYIEDARAVLTTKLKDPERKAMLALFVELEQRKRRESPPDLRLIGEFAFFTTEAGELRLRANEHAPPPLQARKQSARTDRGRRAPADRASDPEAHALFLSIKRFHALAPWRWMENGDVFGVLDPVSGETGWCAIMGAGGQLFGLAVYRGDEGYDCIRRSASGEALEDEALFGQAAFVLAFLDRSELSKDGLALIRWAGATFRGVGAWPQIESHAPNRLPLTPDPAELRFLREVLEQVIAVAPRVRRTPNLVEPDANGRIFLRIPPAGSGDAEWKDARRVPPPPIVRPVPEFDRVRAERIRRSLPRLEIEVECDLFPLQAIIAETGKPPHAPAAFLAVLAGKGSILHMQMSEPAGREAWAVGQFQQMIEQIAGVPAVVYVNRPCLERVLVPVAEAVGARIERVGSLRTLERARKFIERATTRGD